MGKKNVLEVYDEAYAQGYNQDFLLGDLYKPITVFEQETIKKLLDEIGEEATWLDVACGTGYFLSRFPRVERVGLDISPAMLKVAKQANPDTLFVQGDYRDERLYWEGQWDLVSCMWWAYSYVDSLSELEKVIENLANWTSERGVCFLPVCDPEEIGTGEQKLPYTREQVDGNQGAGTYRFEAVIWSWVDRGKHHINLLAPQVENMVVLFQKHFEQVEVIEYSKFKGSARKAIVARSKKQKKTPERTAKIEIPTSSGFFSSFFKAIRSQDWWLYKIPPLLAIAYAEILLLDLPVLQSTLTVFALLFAIACVAAYGHVINDSFDIESDQQVGKHNSMAQFSPWQRALFCLALAVLGFSLPTLMNFGTWAIALLGINYLLPTLYSAPPFRFKEKGVLGIISDAAGAHAIPTLFITTTFAHLVATPSLQVIGLQIAAISWSFFAGVRGILLHQLWDRNDDLKSGVRTLVTESNVEDVRFWMSRIIFPIELLLLSSLILVIGYSSPLILVFTILYFLLKFAFFKSDPTATFDPAPAQKAYVIPHDFYEVGLPLILAIALSLQNSWFAILLLLQVILFYPGIEQRVTSLVQSLRGQPQDLNPLQTGVMQLSDYLQQTQTQLNQTQTELAKLQADLAQAESAQHTSLAELGRFKAYLQHTQGTLGVMDYYHHAIATNPDDLQLYYQALETQPDDAHIHLHLGNALVRQGQLCEAIVRYQTALQFHPDNFEIQLELGKALEKEKRWDEASAAYRQAISLNPHHALAHQHLGDALAERGQIQEASVLYRRVLQLQSKSC